MFKMTKVFDVTNMPANIRDDVTYSWDIVGNGAYITIDVPECRAYLEGERQDYGDSHYRVLTWLLNNGVNYGDKDVAIHYWW